MSALAAFELGKEQQRPREEERRGEEEREGEERRGEGRGEERR